MKIIEARPPNYDDIVRVIGRPPQAAVFTWGDVMYCGHPPYGMKHNFTPDLLAHEERHSLQQKLIGGPGKWWDEYLKNPRFRMIEELEAYRTQYAHVALGASRQVRRLMLRQLAKDFSGPMYGRIIKYADAMEQIKEAV